MTTAVGKNPWLVPLCVTVAVATSPIGRAEEKPFPARTIGRDSEKTLRQPRVLPRIGFHADFGMKKAKEDRAVRDASLEADLSGSVDRFI